MIGYLDPNWCVRCEGPCSDEGYCRCRGNRPPKKKENAMTDNRDTPAKHWWNCWLFHSWSHYVEHMFGGVRICRACGKEEQWRIYDN